MCGFVVQISLSFYAGISAFGGTTISGDVYAWVSVFVLPVNSALNPFLYTLSAFLKKGVCLVAGLCHFIFSPRNNAMRKNEKTPSEKTK